jgi:hypothetical protein
VVPLSSSLTQALELTTGELIPGQVPLLKCRKEGCQPSFTG